MRTGIPMERNHSKKKGMMTMIRPLPLVEQKKKKQSKAVQQIRKADGSARGNTSMYSPMQ